MSVSNMPPPVLFIAVPFLGVLNISRILRLSLTPAAHNNDLLGLASGFLFFGRLSELPNS